LSSDKKDGLAPLDVVNEEGEEEEEEEEEAGGQAPRGKLRIQREETPGNY
jgi:hypothetical protein